MVIKENDNLESTLSFYYRLSFRFCIGLSAKINTFLDFGILDRCRQYDIDNKDRSKVCQNVCILCHDKNHVKEMNVIYF